MHLIHENFLLQNESAQHLYHNYAKQQPIYDYHCHLSPKDIATNRQFKDLYELWLEGDHYKWRAMRSLGIEESYITGDKSPYEKFLAYAHALPELIGNPLYHWSLLELKREFDIDLPLNPDNAKKIWQHCTQALKKEQHHCQNILKRANIKFIGTTDDPTDTLIYHEQIQNQTLPYKVCPSFRPDRAIYITKNPNYLTELEQTTNTTITNFETLCEALEKRLIHFIKYGCRASDHGLNTINFSNKIIENKQLNQIVNKIITKKQISHEETINYQSALLSFLGKIYHKHNIIMQLHLGPLRNNNPYYYSKLGADTGFDSIGDAPIAKALSQFLGHLEESRKLPKTIIYNINPKDNAMIMSMCGNFSQSGIKGKIQFGSAWWFNDQIQGMEAQLITHAQIGVLSTFIGMLTDSRSFLSYPRHEYFRRILCNLLGQWIEQGQLPKDYQHIGKIINNISYHNVKTYFQP